MIYSIVYRLSFLSGITCPALLPIQNGDLLPDICPISGNSFDSSCFYSCKSGYKLTGVGTKTCQANGEWDDKTTPSCNKGKCLIGNGMRSKLAEF